VLAGRHGRDRRIADQYFVDVARRHRVLSTLVPYSQHFVDARHGGRVLSTKCWLAHARSVPPPRPATALDASIDADAAQTRYEAGVRRNR